ncbi:hypothetical protein CY34DRAFT_246193 [Suillus luteus UH-Slu-Lm8-n1]|uniref:Uncharacterized protein n=1 Tax=Suillus luteus UH-Slu-Lm8-n1 TaxID=930992 RepID=A0A0D0BWV1_9AGAM|nr:hypothetical protein CY34DRAFT_246193 [Suillus luteus UH-Slu-Lm8-n1]
MIFSTRTVFNGTASAIVTGYIVHQLKDLDTPATPTLPRSSKVSPWTVFVRYFMTRGQLTASCWRHLYTRFITNPGL